MTLPKKKPNPSKLRTESQKDKFLRAYAEHRTLTAAARQSGLCMTTVRKALKNDVEFRTAIDIIDFTTADELETMYFQRLKEGTKKGIYFKGQKIAEEVEYNLAEMRQALKAFRPQRWNPVIQQKILESEKPVEKEVDVTEVYLKLEERLAHLKERPAIPAVIDNTTGEIDE